MSENKAIDKANLELALSENNKKLLEYTNLADSQIKRQLDKSNFILINDYDPCKDIVLGGLTHYIDFLSYYLSTSEQSFDNIVNTQEQFTNSGVLIYKKKGSFSVSAGLHGKDSTIKNYPVTIEFLLKFNPGNTQSVYFENNNPRIICGYWNTYLHMRSGGGKTWAYDFSKLSTSVNLITVCYTSASDINVYVNGIKLEEQSKTDTWSGSNFSGMYIGKRSFNSNNFAGDIYRARIYNRVLSEEEILSNYNADMEFLNSTIDCIKEYQIDILDYHNSSIGIEDAPVGHIISHMGTKVPKHYLICDGSEYNILNYPYLANHILENFGSYNYFGGDGITTFAVPDLRGEFLRGTGTATRDTGSGAEVGEHQDPTYHHHLYKSGAGDIRFFGKDAAAALNRDNLHYNDNNTATSAGYKVTGASYTASAGSTHYSSRPTNTSVLYCIKYEPTYYTSVHNPLVGRSETVLFEGNYSESNNSNTLTTGIALNDSIENYNELYIEVMYENSGSKIYGHLTTYIKIDSLIGHYGYPTIELFCTNGTSDCLVRINCGFIDDKTLSIGWINESVNWNSPYISKVIGVKYQEAQLENATDDEINTAITDSINLLNEV